MDTHWYYYDWKWGEHTKYCINRGITQTPDCGFNKISMMHMFDKPLFISEWDMAWPNEYRAESPVLAAAYLIQAE